MLFELSCISFLFIAKSKWQFAVGETARFDSKAQSSPKIMVYTSKPPGVSLERRTGDEIAAAADVATCVHYGDCECVSYLRY